MIAERRASVSVLRPGRERCWKLREAGGVREGMGRVKGGGGQVWEGGQVLVLVVVVVLRGREEEGGRRVVLMGMVRGGVMREALGGRVRDVARGGRKRKVVVRRARSGEVYMLGR